MTLGQSLPFFALSPLASVVGAICGIGGGMVGRGANNAAADKLFIALMRVIILISVCNTWRYI